MNLSAEAFAMRRHFPVDYWKFQFKTSWSLKTKPMLNVNSKQTSKIGNKHSSNERDDDNTIFKWWLIYFASYFLSSLQSSSAHFPCHFFCVFCLFDVIKLMSTPQNVYVFIWLATNADKKAVQKFVSTTKTPWMDRTPFHKVLLWEG